MSSSDDDSNELGPGTVSRLQVSPPDRGDSDSDLRNSTDAETARTESFSLSSTKNAAQKKTGDSDSAAPPTRNPDERNTVPMDAASGDSSSGQEYFYGVPISQRAIDLLRFAEVKKSLDLLRNPPRKALDNEIASDVEEKLIERGKAALREEFQLALKGTPDSEQESLLTMLEDAEDFEDAFIELQPGDSVLALYKSRQTRLVREFMSEDLFVEAWALAGADPPHPILTLGRSTRSFLESLVKAQIRDYSRRVIVQSSQFDQRRKFVEAYDALNGLDFGDDELYSREDLETARQKTLQRAYLDYEQSPKSYGREDVVQLLARMEGHDELDKERVAWAEKAGISKPVVSPPPNTPAPPNAGVRTRSTGPPMTSQEARRELEDAKQRREFDVLVGLLRKAKKAVTSSTVPGWFIIQFGSPSDVRCFRGPNEPALRAIEWVNQRKPRTNSDRQKLLRQITHHFCKTEEKSIEKAQEMRSSRIQSLIDD